MVRAHGPGGHVDLGHGVLREQRDVHRLPVGREARLPRLAGHRDLCAGANGGGFVRSNTSSVLDSSPPATMVRAVGGERELHQRARAHRECVVSITRPVAVSTRGDAVLGERCGVHPPAVERDGDRVRTRHHDLLLVDCVNDERVITPSALGGFTAVIERPTYSESCTGSSVSSPGVSISTCADQAVGAVELEHAPVADERHVPEAAVVLHGDVVRLGVGREAERAQVEHGVDRQARRVSITEMVAPAWFTTYSLRACAARRSGAHGRARRARRPTRRPRTGRQHRTAAHRSITASLTARSSACDPARRTRPRRCW